MRSEIPQHTIFFQRKNRIEVEGICLPRSLILKDLLCNVRDNSQNYSDTAIHIHTKRLYMHAMLLLHTYYDAAH